ncbi:hypothetical protein HDV03_001418 [Kappamyces sp. JEL0829]|nr:hypothetical protein HDV03_001418 [Kappamyces sp. JEL0829]
MSHDGLLDLLTKRYNLVLNEADKSLLKQSVLFLGALSWALFVVRESLWPSRIVGVFSVIAIGNILTILWKLVANKAHDAPSTPQKPAIKTREQSTPGSARSLMNSPALDLMPSPTKHSRLLFLRSSPMSPQLQDTALINRLVAKETASPSMLQESSPFQGSISLNSRFQHALKPTQSPVRKEVIEDGLVFKDAELSLEQWRVENYIDTWSDRLREWLASHVFQTLVARIDKVDAALKSMGWDHLTCAKATFAESLNLSPQQPSQSVQSFAQQPFAFGSSLAKPLGTFGQAPPSNSLFSSGAPAKSNQVPHSLIDLQSLYGKEPFAAERMALERHLSFDNNTRGYVIERIRGLARGSGLAQFRWNSGVKYNDIPWNNQQFPSDALLVMTLFCRFMDEKCPGEGFSPNPLHPFTSKYFIDMPKSSKPWGLTIELSTGIKIRQAAKYPPHYQLLIDQVVYDVANGRNNVFDTICLFVHQIKTNYNGKLGLLSLGSKGMDLLQIVS